MISSTKEKFYIVGGSPLSGVIKSPGSKNAALPILAATLAIDGVSKLSNVPDLSDTREFINIMKSLGVKAEYQNDVLEIDASEIVCEQSVEHHYISKMRASILFLAPLLIRCGEVKMPFPGGCVLGKRSVYAHLQAFVALGAEIIESEKFLHLRLPKKRFQAGVIVMPEISVTATENAIIAASFAEGVSQIRLAACEPHVQNLCEFLVSAGVQIDGIGSHTLTIRGIYSSSSGAIKITSDYLQVGTYMLAGILTNSEITIEDVEITHFDSFLERILHAGANFQYDEIKRTITTKPRTKDLIATDIQTGVFPKFPTDLHPQFSVLLTQCVGRSKVFETLFERKFSYLLELEKMGADIEIQNPHVFLINGPKKLTGTSVASQDIRAGAAMLLAALVAQGETEISNIHYIHRGYENILETLTLLGANIRKGS